MAGGENFDNGVALNRMDGGNSAPMIRHTFSELSEEQRVFEAWHGSYGFNYDELTCPPGMCPITALGLGYKKGIHYGQEAMFC